MCARDAWLPKQSRALRPGAERVKADNELEELREADDDHGNEAQTGDDTNESLLVAYVLQELFPPLVDRRL